MNPAFSQDSEGWPEFPKVSYGRLDQTEPLVLDGAAEAMFAFDVVDANWGELSSSGRLDLSDVHKIRTWQEHYWRRLFGRLDPGSPLDLYETAPIYRIEVTSKPDDRHFESLVKIKESDWVRIELDHVGDLEVDVYGGLFAAPVQASIRKIEVETRLAPALTAAFDMDTWPDASEVDMESAISGLPHLDYLVAYDVGQGSANSLSDAQETAQIFFDLGCGVYRNRKTRPIPLRFCWRATPPIILSHWDCDHWAGETSDPSAAGRTWIAPRQTIGPTHAAFAARILSAGGVLHIWGATPTIMTIPVGPRQILTLARCSGSSRNGSGISCAVKGSAASNGWLLTGDAGYHELNQPALPPHLHAIVVPHHGADMGVSSTPPRPPIGYARLLYSFGPGNKHGRTSVQHPTVAAVNAHISQGWNHSHWTAATPATCIAGGHVLATASHPSTHLDGTVVSWAAPPSVPFATVPCAGVPAGPVGCTGKIMQA